MPESGPGSAKGPRSLGQVLEEALREPDGMLSGLAARARAQARLTDHLRTALATRTAGHVLSCALQEDGTVTVAVDSAAWATRLRFDQARLLAHARELHPEAKDVQVRVARQGG